MVDHEKEIEKCEKDGHEACCKWCSDCVIHSDGIRGHCYNDIGELVKVNVDLCCEFTYDTDLDRC